ncbi:MAG TPA: aldolase/citrate lyase family protein [Burkholderiales bacterium]|nr:aldolase/citrate lyase family protein [Burkholderiales bacterium]
MTQRSIRSWLIIPASNPASVDEAARSGADAVVLDLVEFVTDGAKPEARANVRSAIAAAGAGGAQVYVQTEASALAADLHASVFPGLAGVVLSRAQSAQEIVDLECLLADLEDERDLSRQGIGIVPALETAQGNHAAYDIARASGRVQAVTLGRVDLVMDLRPEPSGEIHLLSYLMQRLVIVAGAVGVTPLGAWWRAPDRGLLATPENTLAAARRGRAIGFKGAMCLRANQVDALNQAYA